MKIAVITLDSPSWSAGASYTTALAQSLALVQERGTELAFVGATPYVLPNSIVRLPVERPDLSWKGKIIRHGSMLRDRAPLLPREMALRHRLGVADRSSPLVAANTWGADVVVPFVRGVPTLGMGTVGWIADFQHRRMPQYFSAGECRSRDQEFSSLAQRADRMLVSSAAVRADFAAFLPQHLHKVDVAHFPSLLAFEPPKSDDGARQRYGIPEKFALVINQFWAHKNHVAVVRSIADARSRGVDVPVVMLGRPDDYRDPANKTISTLLQTAASLGVRDLLWMLGEVTFAELLGLLRDSSLVVQPSRFEGWSTTVQDARALGKPVLCARTPTLLEQAPDARGFFDLDDASDLGATLAAVWPELRVGRDGLAEAAGRERELGVARGLGTVLLRACALAAGSHHR